MWITLNAPVQGVDMTDPKESVGHDVDLEEATQLVQALERDLGKVSGDSADIQLLRDEVARLKVMLDSPAREHHDVKQGLHSIRDTFERALDEAVADGMKGSQYVAELGRILGM
jgi:predicted nuclease with TOPRIM domain